MITNSLDQLTKGITVNESGGISFKNLASTLTLPNESGTLATQAYVDGKSEYVSNSYGEAIKFDSGLVLMNVFVNSTGSTPSVGSSTVVKPLPVSLVGHENATVTFTQGVGGHIFLASAMGYCADANNVTLILGNTTGSARTYVITRATVVGRWK